MLMLELEKKKKKKDPVGGSELSTHTNFLTIISISLFCCCKKVFTHKNTWIIKKKLNELSLPRIEDNLKMEDITYADYMHSKRDCKLSEYVS